MAYYRLYFLNEAGRIAHAIELDCDDDDHAIRTVESHIDGRPMELWNQDRHVKTFAGKGSLAIVPAEE